MFNQEWEIKPRADFCKMCQQPFADGQVYVSSLIVAAQGYERADCCESCWQQAVDRGARRAVPAEAGHDQAWPATAQEPGQTPAAGAGCAAPPPPNGTAPALPKVGDAFSVWKGTFQAELPPPEVLKKETAESLLRKLIEKNDPYFRNAIFILAVMLERKRILVEREVQKRDDDTTLRVYEHRQTGETFIITDPMLNLNQIGQIQEEIAVFLSGQETLPAGSPSRSDDPKQSESDESVAKVPEKTAAPRAGAPPGLL